jgi:hypothetical protein
MKGWNRKVRIWNRDRATRTGKTPASTRYLEQGRTIPTLILPSFCPGKAYEHSINFQQQLTSEPVKVEKLNFVLFCFLNVYFPKL